MEIPSYVHSVHDTTADNDINKVTMADILKFVRIRRVDGLPVTKLAQDSLNQFTFHFIRNAMIHQVGISQFKFNNQKHSGTNFVTMCTK